MTCVDISVEADAPATVANFDTEACRGEPFQAIERAFADRQAPAYEPALNISQTSARAWALIYAALLVATMASALAGAAMAIVGSRQDANVAGWLWGGGLALVAGVIGYVVTMVSGREVLRVTSSPGSPSYEIDYAKLGGPWVSIVADVALFGGCVMLTAIVAVGHRLRSRASNRAGDLEVAIYEVRRAGTTVSLVLLALTATLSLGSLAASARFRLIEHLPGAGDYPGLLGILYGVLYTTIVAALYFPTQARLIAARNNLLDWAAGTGLDDERLERRARVRAELDRELPVGGAAGRAATVLSPFLAAAASSLLL